ncbi:MAG: SDR family NAD(P)-dependent oxidoreductase [Acidimicrobiia bacterium]
MTERHLLVTGASRGIGGAAAIGLAEHFPAMTLVGRSPERHREVVDALDARGVRTQFVECDLSSLGSVDRAIASVESPVDVLLANAGVGGQRGVTQDGFEIHFGVNHLAHHLLVTGLADRIHDRVVVVSSNAHYDSVDLDLDAIRRPTKSLTGIGEYRNSKLANVLFGRELARRHDFGVVIVHPGVTATAIWRRIPWPIRPLITRSMATPEEGADTPVWAATTRGLQSGGYYARRTLRIPSEEAMDDEAAQELWERSEKWVAEHRRTR